MRMRRPLIAGLILTLCASATGLGLAVHLRLAAHEHSHSHDQCPTCFAFLVGSKAVIEKGSEVAASVACFLIAPIPTPAPAWAERRRTGDPRAPPTA